MKKEYRILSAAALLLLLGTVTGCAQSEPAQAPEATQTVQTQETDAAGKDTAPAAEEKGGDGVYTAVAKGFGGDVTVTVRIEGGKLTGVTAEENRAGRAACGASDLAISSEKSFRTPVNGEAVFAFPSTGKAHGLKLMTERRSGNKRFYI